MACLAFGLGACSGEDAEFAQFAGIWEYQSGTETEKCGMEPEDTSQLQGSLLYLNEGTDAPVVIAGSGCIIRFDVSGGALVARPDQTCVDSFEDARLGTVTITRTVTSFRIAANGLNATETSAGTITYRATGATGMLDCSFSTTGTLKKIAK